MKLRYRIFIIFLLIALIPLITLTLIAYGRYKSTTYDRMDEISRNIFNNSLSEMNKTLDGIEQSSAVFTFYSDGDFSIIENLKKFSDPNSVPDNYAIFKANNNINFVCKNILYSYNYIYGLYVFTPSGAVLSHRNGQNGDLLYQYDPSGEDWYKQTLDLKGKLYASPIQDQKMFSGTVKSLFFSKALYDVYSHKFLGVLVIDCAPTLFDLTNVNTLPDTTLFRLTNTQNHSTLYDTSALISSRFSKKDTVTLTDSLYMSNLKLSATFDYNALYKEFKMTGVLLVLAALICGAAVVLLSYVLSKYLTYPIEHLSRKMSHQNGTHLTRSEKFLSRSDEIGTLYNEYNAMIEELNATIKREYQDKLITMDAQMRSLEAQINSHFLFNTLESINSLAELDDNERISTMVLSLGNMFRYSIKTQSELVTIADEVAHVQDYVSIQMIRFDQRFHLDLDIPEEMQKHHVLKLILQPLVENALYHGLNYCTHGDTISVHGHLEPGMICLEVADNGIGMQEDELAAVNRKLTEESSFTELGHRTRQSIGLKNIHTRIELYYGKGYGLTVTSEPDIGTRILIRVPRNFE